MKLPDFDAACRLSRGLRILNQEAGKNDDDEGVVAPWQINDEQKALLLALILHARVIVLKGRQIGSSTVCCYFIALCALMNPGIPCAVVADTRTKAEGLLSKARGFLEQMTDGQAVIEANKGSVTLYNGSTIDALSAVAHADGGESRVGRSKSYAFVLCSELAFWANDRSVFAALTSTALKHARIIVESTATASENLFRELWESSDNGWHHIFFSVEAHTGYRAANDDIDDEQWQTLQHEYGFTIRESAAWWWRKLKTDFSGDVFRCLREYPIQPHHAFSAAEGRWILRYTQIEPIAIEDGWRVYQRIDPDDPVVLGVDTGAGRGLDRSFIAVLKRSDMTAVATWASNTTPIPDFAAIAIDTCAQFHPVATVVETNGMGHAVYDALADVHNTNVVEQVSGDSSGEKHMRLFRLRELIESGAISVGEDVVNEIKKSVIVRTSSKSLRTKFDGPDDGLNAISFAVKWIEANRHVIRVREKTPIERFRERFKKRKRAKVSV